MRFFPGLDFPELFKAGHLAVRSSSHFCEAGSIVRPSRGPRLKAA
jgi:hypothetical protein